MNTRLSNAYDALRGRPPRPDYGLLIVFPLLAASVGALIGIGVDQLVVRLVSQRDSSRPAGRTPATGPALIPN
ncbi:hypothetical protein OWR29_02475 [Actinoplanes sp. Pm04-4]|uniref:Uncharacterized protein n=1 Tax=Paractinoplanes pyxinae TaxID=2997416 RepID=A0ABT4ARN1_9ACTN|nr:hypothetical protein [Actinoplanes pyxinae]MCY1136847.1 hypothetical protein [Actinoplanes pyxinae]